jgi:hypothetical protein
MHLEHPEPSQTSHATISDRVSIDVRDMNDRGVIVLVGACASRRGTEDDKGQGGEGLWERVDLVVVVVVDGICEGNASGNGRLFTSCFDCCA